MPAEPKAVDSTHGEVIYALLTSQVWTDRHPDNVRPFGMCPVGEGDSEFRFLANGLYEHRWIPLAGGDAVIKLSARWNLEKGPRGRWLACFENGERHVVSLFENGIIELGGYKYPKSKLEQQKGAKKFDEMSTISLPEEAKQRIAVLTSRKWHRANDVNLDRYPLTIEFRDDFTYIARYASGHAVPTGTWYATSDTVVMNGTPDAPGETADIKNGEYFRVMISNADQLVINNSPYVPQEQLKETGTILHFGGHGEPICVRVEYKMPIRRGIPCRFDIHFISAPNMTLQRFSLTKEFEHGYRLPDGTFAPVDEFAAINLNNRKLDVGESKSFSVDVVFPEAGDQYYYLNAMIKGQQNWDEREAVLFRILEKE